MDGTMKTTLELPDELMRTVKVRAAREDRKLKDMMALLLRRGLTDPQKSDERVTRRVDLPLVRCAHPALPEEEMTPERAAEVLAESDAASATRDAEPVR